MQVKPHLGDPNFEPEVVAKSSKAAMGLCKWVRAMMLYYDVSKVVGPKRIALAHAEEAAAATQAELEEKKQALAALIAKLEQLTLQYASVVKEKEQLEKDYNDCLRRMDHANRLIGGLGGERTRWAQRSLELTDAYECLIGDVTVCAAIIGYLGPFTLLYRNNAIQNWLEVMAARGLVCSENFSLRAVLGEPVRIREWQALGLPSDAYSADNGIMISRSSFWPLLFDPQGQASKWIRSLEKEHGLSLMRPTDNDYMRLLQNAVQLGHAVLCENMQEELDPSLEPLLSRDYSRNAHGRRYIRLGDGLVEVAEGFRFYMATKLANPHYKPEVSSKAVLINFTITQEGLEEQLLAVVVFKERPDLEAEKSALVLEGASNVRKLKDLEDRVLQARDGACTRRDGCTRRLERPSHLDPTQPHSLHCLFTSLLFLSLHSFSCPLEQPARWQ